METIIKVNKGLLSDKHLVLTNMGWIEAKDLKINDNLINHLGKIVKIKKINKCGKRPNATIIDD